MRWTNRLSGAVQVWCGVLPVWSVLWSLCGLLWVAALCCLHCSNSPYRYIFCHQLYYEHLPNMKVCKPISHSLVRDWDMLVVVSEPRYDEKCLRMLTHSGCYLVNGWSGRPVLLEMLWGELLRDLCTAGEWDQGGMIQVVVYVAVVLRAACCCCRDVSIEPVW